MHAVRSARRGAAGTIVAALASILTIVVASAGLAAVTTASASADTRVMSLSSDTYEHKVQQLINERRGQHGLAKLSLESCTDGTAERWALKLAESHEFYHQSMGDIIDRCGAHYAGETLGKGAISPDHLVRLWMQSPPHRKVLLSKHAKRIGVGAYTDSTGAWVTAANFTRF
ncbi:MAG TPA: CAP domain-containing protein [Nocardioides sp.]|uniref:CAP domain-containing protein n=1 Tax=Nocardioides sp. TaxID=35761 RepID=UPI002D8021EF|nr:CAP domain-containing protein [Nocardioides sp.]HET6653645.1 CAP domain-containing protein [Nocardioides sp.]